jgi:hypothetical protein
VLSVLVDWVISCLFCWLLRLCFALFESFILNETFTLCLVGAFKVDLSSDTRLPDCA